ncbi:MAG: hypothetical protein AAF570_03270 [Bacteroidota bacterium]
MHRTVLVLILLACCIPVAAQDFRTPPSGARACFRCNIAQYDSTTAHYAHWSQTLTKEFAGKYALPNFEAETGYYNISNSKKIYRDIPYPFHLYRYDETTPCLSFKVFFDRAGRPVEICAEGKHVNNVDFEIVPILLQARLPRLLPWQKKGQVYRMVIFRFAHADLVSKK